MDAQVSAIITTYKRNESFLERAIVSVLKQTYSNLELLIVDDNGKNSPYHSIVSSIVEKYKNNGHNIQLIAHEENQGAQRARNTGIKHAKGEFIAFLDDDDEWLEIKIEEQLKLFSVDKNIGLVYCWYNVLTEQENGEVLKEPVELPQYSDEQILPQLLRANYIASTSFPLIKKECFNTVGFFDEALEASQDYDMWVRITKQFKIRCVNKPLVNYYKHVGERITSNNAKKSRAEKMFLEKHFEDIKHDKLAFSEKNKKIGIYLMRLGKGKEARKHFRESIRKSPGDIRTYKYYIESFYLQRKKLTGVNKKN